MQGDDGYMNESVHHSNSKTNIEAEGKRKRVNDLNFGFANRGSSKLSQSDLESAGLKGSSTLGTAGGPDEGMQIRQLRMTG